MLRHPLGQIVARMATSSNRLPFCQQASLLPPCLNSPLPHSPGEEIIELIVICLPWIINSTLNHFGQGNGTGSCAQWRLDSGCGISQDVSVTRRKNADQAQTGVQCKREMVAFLPMATSCYVQSLLPHG